MRRRLVAVIPTLVVVAALAGCAGTSGAAIDRDASAQLQSAVVTVADHASAGDTTGALAALDQVQAALDQAEAAGTITAERASTVQQNIDVVRADLQPAADTATAPSGEAPATEAPATEAPATETPVSTPVETEEPTDPAAPADKGPGNGSGNGNGNGPGGNSGKPGNGNGPGKK